MENAPSYRYVGPAVLAEHAGPGLGRDHCDIGARPGPVARCQLRLAARRSEHVDCAAGGRCWPPVRCFFADWAGWSVIEISNQPPATVLTRIPG